MHPENRFQVTTLARSRRRDLPVVLVNLATAVDVQDAVRRLVAAVHRAVGRSWKTLLQDFAAKLRVTLTVTPSPDGAAPSAAAWHRPG